MVQLFEPIPMLTRQNAVRNEPRCLCRSMRTAAICHLPPGKSMPRTLPSSSPAWYSACQTQANKAGVTQFRFVKRRIIRSCGTYNGVIIVLSIKKKVTRLQVVSFVTVSISMLVALLIVLHRHNTRGERILALLLKSNWEKIEISLRNDWRKTEGSDTRKMSNTVGPVEISDAKIRNLLNLLNTKKREPCLCPFLYLHFFKKRN